MGVREGNLARPHLYWESGKVLLVFLLAKGLSLS